MAGSGKATPQARVQRIPPIPKAERAEAEAFAQIGGVSAYILYQFVRDTKLWGDCPEENREGLFFPPQARVLAQMRSAQRHLSGLEAPLQILEAMVRFPQFAERGKVAGACRTISRWADQRRLPALALEYAEAAALADPYCAESAADAGQMCFRTADVSRAVVWYQRAAVLARRAENWEWYVRTCLRFGFLYFQKGELLQAKRLYQRASWRARSTGRRKLAAAAQHDLLTLAVMECDYSTAQEHAKRAFYLYPQKHPGLPRLALDYSHLLIRTGFYTRALMLLDAALPLLHPPPVRMVGLSNLALAAASVQERARYESASEEVLEAVAQSEEFASVALMQIADGARRLSLWTQAEERARRAIEIGERRGEDGVCSAAHEVLSRIQARCTLPVHTGMLDGGVVQELTRDLARRLRKQRETPER